MIDVTRFSSGGLWIPASDSQSPYLLVALHGSGGSCENFRELGEALGIEGLNYLYLNGPIRSYSNYHWYDSNHTPREAYRYLHDVFDRIRLQGYSPSQTILLGFSQGAALTFEFGARYPHLFAGYVAISGRIEDLPALLNEGNPSIIRQADWLVTHGTRDYNLSSAIMKQQVDELVRAGYHIDYQEYDKIHEFDAEVELPYIRDWIVKHLA